MSCTVKDCFYDGMECRECKRYNPGMAFDRYLSTESLSKSAPETCLGGQCTARDYVENKNKDNINK